MNGLRSTDRKPPEQEDGQLLAHNASESNVIELDPAKTLDNPFQPRIVRNPKADKELAESVASSGIHQPILVTPPNAEGFYTVVAGHRRRDAALQNRLRCPAIERTFSVDEMEQIATIENIQREGMALADEVKAVARLAYKHSNKTAAKLLGKPTGYVSKAIKMSQTSGSLADLLTARPSLDASAFYELTLLHDKAPKVASAIARRWRNDPNQSLSLRKQVAKAKAALVQVGAITELNKSNKTEIDSLSGSDTKSEAVPVRYTPCGFAVTGNSDETLSLQFTLDDETTVTVDLAQISWSRFRDAINR